MLMPLLAFLAASSLVGSSLRKQPPLVSTAWLADHLHDKGLVIFHIGDRTSRPTYDAGHIPGAQFLSPGTELSTPRVEGALALELPSVEVLDSVLEARGISDESQVVLYAAQQYFTPTSRAFFTLEYLGMQGRVSILDGGLEAWKAEGRALSTEEPRPTAGHFTPRLHPELVVDASFVNGQREDSNVRVVDARDSSFYHGRETRQGRNGHIPGAVNIPFQTLVDSSGKFKAPVVLQAQFREAGVRDGQTVVSYCHIGQQASLVWFAARLLGFEAKLYDGSFQDWAARKELPVQGERRP